MILSVLKKGSPQTDKRTVLLESEAERRRRGADAAGRHTGPKFRGRPVRMRAGVEKAELD